MTPLELGARERIRRAARTGSAIAQIYLGYKGLHLLDRGPLRGVVGAARRRWDRVSAATLGGAARDLGGVLLKAGQFLSTRADVLPPAYVERLARLQDRARPQPYALVHQVLEEDLGAAPEELFARIWRRPMAAASLAQVHRATLHDGREVAVKVQRADVRAALSADLATLRVAARAIEGLEGSLGFSLLLDQLEDSLGRELDFALEATSAGRLARCFAGSPEVRIPAVIGEFTRPRVLVTEYLPGIRVTDRARLQRAGVDPAAVVEALLRAYAAQVFEHGLFHADPHPGNLLVLPGEAGAFALGFVDFGIVQEVPAGFRAAALELARAVLARDAAGAAAALRALGLTTRDPQARTIERFAEKLMSHLDARAAGGALAGERIARLGEELQALLRADPLATLPPHLFLLGRVLGLLAGVSAQLGVRANLARALLPSLFEARSGPR
ncbi:MAG TPA: AarF/UbiB family protein [Myxococcota bacterium]|nr:AarF/UbiB family protein [Myxococcota bacterium]